MIDALFVLVTLVVGGMVLRRLMRRRWRTAPGPVPSGTSGLPEPFTDGFYCLLLRDGSTRGGFVDEQPAGAGTVIRRPPNSPSSR